MPTFIRRSWYKHKRIGKNNKKAQVWRRPKGRDSKTREKRRGVPVVVSVGYSKDKSSRGRVKGKIPFVVENMVDAKKIGKENVALIGRIGKKKKLEIIKELLSRKIEIANMNPRKYVKKNTKIKEEKEAKKAGNKEMKKEVKGEEKSSENKKHEDKKHVKEKTSEEGENKK